MHKLTYYFLPLYLGLICFDSGADECITPNKSGSYAGKLLFTKPFKKTNHTSYRDSRWQFVFNQPLCVQGRPGLEIKSVTLKRQLLDRTHTGLFRGNVIDNQVILVGTFVVVKEPKKVAKPHSPFSSWITLDAKVIKTSNDNLSIKSDQAIRREALRMQNKMATPPVYAILSEKRAQSETAPPIVKAIPDAAKAGDTIKVLPKIGSTDGASYKKAQGGSQNISDEATNLYFPWPIPSPSSQIDFTLYSKREIERIRPTYGQANRRLQRLLFRADYTNQRYYLLNKASLQGFAIATQLEQIDVNALPLPDPNRWSADVVEASLFSMSEFLKALLQADQGYFRVLVFVISNKALTYSKEEATKETASKWLEQGQNRLFEEVIDWPYTQQSTISVLVYEFEHDENTNTYIQRQSPPRHTAKTHLNSTDLKALLKDL
ncbi:hypothetical protein [Paraglaciecola sp.]|uniref:hypothetical protein n=1 Tax=Paraglaciecola sp. TaxID=1920173 RepID=UPI003EF308DF